MFHKIMKPSRQEEITGAGFFRSIYNKLVRINDSPQKVALGFGLGIFVGIMPGIGLIASLLLATLFGVNRASALAANLLVNTWFGVVIFLPALRIGVDLIGWDWHTEHQEWLTLVNNFHWSSLLSVSTYEILAPIALGYLVISFFSGILAYLLILFIVSRRGR